MSYITLKYKKYTGKGNTVNNVNINDGIANPQNAYSYIKTSLSQTFLNKKFTVQIKQKNNDPNQQWPSTMFGKGLNTNKDYLCFYTSNTKNFRLGIWRGTTDNINEAIYFTIPANDYYKKWVYIIMNYDGTTNVTITIKDENNEIKYQETQQLFREIDATDELLYFFYPQEGDAWNASATEVDLKETWIRDENNKIISPWNL